MPIARDPASHKGDNGKVAIIGGSRHQHGAPLFAALAAEASGVDLLYVFAPACHEVTVKQASLNFQFHPFGTPPADDHPSDELSDWDTVHILEFLATMDSAIIGPGLSRTPTNLKMVEKILAEASCPLVCDASALQDFTLQAVKGKHAILTPHRGELERMNVTPEELPQAAMLAGATILLKGPTDILCNAKRERKEFAGGNAGLTHGGTGDALSGLIAGLIAQHVDAQRACELAATIIKRAGADLSAQRGFAYTARDVIGEIPRLLQALTA